MSFRLIYLPGRQMGQRSVFTIGIIYPHQQSPAVLENFHIQYSINLQSIRLECQAMKQCLFESEWAICFCVKCRFWRTRAWLRQRGDWLKWCLQLNHTGMSHTCHGLNQNQAQRSGSRRRRADTLLFMSHYCIPSPPICSYRYSAVHAVCWGCLHDVSERVHVSKPNRVSECVLMLSAWLCILWLDCI